MAHNTHTSFFSLAVIKMATKAIRECLIEELLNDNEILMRVARKKRTMISRAASLPSLLERGYASGHAGDIKAAGMFMICMERVKGVPVAS